MSKEFEKLLLENSSYLKRFAYTLCRDETLAEDLVQTTLLRAWRSRDTFQIGTNFKGWLSTILYNTHIMHWRLKSTQKERISLTVSSDEDDKETQYDVEIDPRQENLALLQQCYDKTFELKGRYGYVIRYLVFDQLSYEECAVKLDIKIGTVKSLLHRALEEFRYLFNNENQLAN
ncbi:RNA polymerase sigma-70 factor protein [Rhizobium phage RHph_N34]|uniref:RNA polymerase sigma-70 factor protein n=1 Tax=Rhizobium phage RHph_N34 TaxID=2509586 RepID=A0A7S5UWZ9_9CAUD|nr:RNA polymerase sigma-70 factor protein [Rhizobium phage RHph_N34]QIG73830.1 RNA polymerase sigma-70 factor protein [Rhizobium phage RHph_N34]